MFNTNHWNVQYQPLECSKPTTGMFNTKQSLMFNTNHWDVQYQAITDVQYQATTGMIKTQYPTTGLTGSQQIASSPHPSNPLPVLKLMKVAELHLKDTHSGNHWTARTSLH